VLLWKAGFGTGLSLRCMCISGWIWRFDDSLDGVVRCLGDFFDMEALVLMQLSHTLLCRPPQYCYDHQLADDVDYYLYMPSLVMMNQYHLHIICSSCFEPDTKRHKNVKRRDNAVDICI